MYQRKNQRRREEASYPSYSRPGSWRLLDFRLAYHHLQYLVTLYASDEDLQLICAGIFVGATAHAAPHLPSRLARKAEHAPLPITTDMHVHHKSGRPITSRCRVLSVLLKIRPIIASFLIAASCGIQVTLLPILLFSLIHLDRYTPA